LNDNPKSDTEEVETFAVPGKQETYTDGRKPGDWNTRYQPEARKCINIEATILCVVLVILTVISGILLGLTGETIDIPISALASRSSDGSSIAPNLHVNATLLLTYFVGCLGGTMYAIKWLIHSVAKCKWHLDRRYWRLFVPFMGGVYACVLLTLLDGGLIGFQSNGAPRSAGLVAAYSFLVGYFSDGVSGLLSNLANAIFGTLDKK
jgi:hypothetical protein